MFSIDNKDAQAINSTYLQEFVTNQHNIFATRSQFLRDRKRGLYSDWDTTVHALLLQRMPHIVSHTAIQGLQNMFNFSDISLNDELLPPQTSKLLKVVLAFERF